jgi:hypothetical protein
VTIGYVRASRLEVAAQDGDNIMRYLLSLGLLIVLCSSSSAAPIHHLRSHRHVVVRPGWTSSFAAVPEAYARARPPIQYDDTPSYNDPSKSGGSTALPIQN